MIQVTHSLLKNDVIFLIPAYNSHGAELEAESQPSNGRIVIVWEKLLGIKTNNHLYTCLLVIPAIFSVTRSGVTYVTTNDQDQSLIF